MTWHNRIYRSAAFAEATPNDRQALDEAGIRWVCDLRAPGERGSRPQGGPTASSAQIWFNGDAPSVGSVLDTVVSPDATPGKVRAIMIATYRTLPFSHDQAWAAILNHAAEGRVPMVIHCSVGKDRTGVAIAILLDLLGVSRHDIIADYLRTQSAFDALSAFILSGPKGELLRTAGQAIWAPMIGVEAAYLQATFDTIDAQYGDVARYAREVLLFDDVEGLRAALLEPREAS